MDLSERLHQSEEEPCPKIVAPLHQAIGPHAISWDPLHVAANALLQALYTDKGAFLADVRVLFADRVKQTFGIRHKDDPEDWSIQVAVHRGGSAVISWQRWCAANAALSKTSSAPAVSPAKVLLITLGDLKLRASVCDSGEKRQKGTPRRIAQPKLQAGSSNPERWQTRIAPPSEYCIFLIKIIFFAEPSTERCLQTLSLPKHMSTFPTKSAEESDYLIFLIIFVFALSPLQSDVYKHYCCPSTCPRFLQSVYLGSGCKHYDLSTMHALNTYW